MKTELKGIISKTPNDVHITCCRSVPRIEVGGDDVYDLLNSQMKELQSREEWPRRGEPGYEEDEDKEWRIRYIVQDAPFSENAVFEDVAARVQLARIYSEVDRGCYSEWTCGVGGFDFMMDGKGHSLLSELASYEGQYVWLKFL